MVKLTVDIIQNAWQCTNPVKDRELDLRGYKIGVIENLGATLDQFDSIDLSDNDIRKLDGFPLLRRLKTILLNNNRICRIAEGLEEHLPQLETLILTNNDMQNMGDIDPLASIKTLRTLSLLKNPISVRKQYRLYIIHRLPQLRILDFRRIRQQERQEAERLFGGEKGKKLVDEIGKRSRTFVPGEGLTAAVKGVVNAAVTVVPAQKKSVSNDDVHPPGVTESDGVAGGDGVGVDSNPAAMAIREAIANATTLDEVERLKEMLKSGQVPGDLKNGSAAKAAVAAVRANDEEMEEDDEEVENGTGNIENS